MTRDEKIHKVMKEFKDGTLKTSSGELVTDRKQAIAIAMSEAESVSKSEVEESLQDLIKEHKRLVNVLESDDHKDDKKEAKIQKKELEEYESELTKGLFVRSELKKRGQAFFDKLFNEYKEWSTYDKPSEASVLEFLQNNHEDQARPFFVDKLLAMLKEDVEKAVKMHRLAEDYDKIAEYKEKYPTMPFFDLLTLPNTAKVIDIDKLFKGFEDLIEKSGVKGMKWDEIKKLNHKDVDNHYKQLLDKEEQLHNEMIVNNLNKENASTPAYKVKEFNEKNASKKAIKESFEQKQIKKNNIRKQFGLKYSGAMYKIASNVHAKNLEDFKKQLNSALQMNSDTKSIRVNELTEKQVQTLYELNHSEI